MRLKTTLTIVLFLAAITLGTAQVNFLPVQTFSTGSRTLCLATGDINNDQLADIVVVNGYSSGGSPFDFNLVLYYQLSDGDLSAPNYIPYPSGNMGASSISIGDINHDDINEIVFGYADSIMILYQNLEMFGEFDSTASYYCGATVDAIVINDIDNDNLADIIVTHWNSTYFKIFYQSISNSWEIIDYPAPQTGYIDLEIADINNDNLGDILIVADGGYQFGFYVIEQSTKRKFNSPIRYQLEEQTICGLAVKDINNDSLPDVLISGGGNYKPYILVYYNDSTSNFFEKPKRLDTYDIPQPVSVADLNCDGSMEIITTHSGWHALTVFDKKPSGDYSKYTKFYNTDGNYSFANETMVIDDLNGDMSPDIALTTYHNEWVIFYNDSKPYISDSVSIRKPYFVDTSKFSYIFLDSVLIESNSNIQITKIDSFLISDSTQYIYGYDYQFYIREGEICSGYYRDSLLNDSIYYNEILSYSDTSLISTIYDTAHFVSATPYLNNFENVQIFPNPASGAINIKITNIKKHDRVVLNLYNSTGQLLLSDKIIDENHLLDISSYKGVLILKLLIDRKEVTYKVINN